MYIHVFKFSSDFPSRHIFNFAQCKTVYKKSLSFLIYGTCIKKKEHSVLNIMFKDETLQCCGNWHPVEYVTVIWSLLTWYPVYAIWTITRLTSVYTVLHHLLEPRQSGINFRNLCWAIKRITVISWTNKKEVKVIESIKRWWTQKIT